MKKKFLFPLIAIASGFIIASVLGEIVLRIAVLGFGNAPLESDPVFHHVHPADYRFTIHTPDGEYGGHTVYYNKDRLISDPEIEDRSEDGTTCRIAFLGDSFTEAAQVEFRKSFVGILKRSSACKVWNFAVSSYSPIFYELQWRKIVRDLKPTLVVVQLFSNDISSDGEYYKIAKLAGNGDVLAIPGPGGGWFVSQLRKLYLMRFLRKTQLQLKWISDHKGKDKNIVEGIVEEDPEISPLSSGIMLRLSGEVKASGSEFAFFAIPSKARYRNEPDDQAAPEFSDKWKQWAEKQNITFIDLVHRFKDAAREGHHLFYDKDIHLNEAGNAVLAGEIAKRYPVLFNSAEIQLIK